jgi:hypothetical protein
MPNKRWSPFCRGKGGEEPHKQQQQSKPNAQWWKYALTGRQAKDGDRHQGGTSETTPGGARQQQNNNNHDGDEPPQQQQHEHRLCTANLCRISHIIFAPYGFEKPPAIPSTPSTG